MALVGGYKSMQQQVLCMVMQDLNEISDDDDDLHPTSIIISTWMPLMGPTAQRIGQFK